ncbi:hypothetical protein EJ110_NYTH27695 [Nymphaea thermarum]|nr:hypothetical protein EJ110_NYTH27695 [Nymphaea thermarum]
MDDYQMILSIELLSAAKMVPMPHLRSVNIMDEKSPCMVPVVTLRKDKSKVAMISVLQLNKGPKHGDGMDLVATREVSKNSPGLVPEALAPILEEFAGTTPAKLPRWRPPRHKVGHAPTELKKLADRRRRSMEFRAGDQVLVKLYADRAGIFRGRHRARIRKYEGPFTVVKRMGKLAYKLDLPLHFKVHPVFHVCNLQPFYADDEDPKRSIVPSC